MLNGTGKMNFMSNSILVVDDDPNIRDVVCFALEKAGMSTTAARNGAEALKLASAHMPDLVILDINMPRMNGIELAEALHAEGRIAAGLKIVMLTTEGHADLIQRAKSAGAKGWIVKPFKPEMLLAAVQKMAA